MLAGVFVVMQLVVFGVKQMDPGMGVMKAADLLLQGNELIPFFGIAGDGKNLQRQPEISNAGSRIKG